MRNNRILFSGAAAAAAFLAACQASKTPTTASSTTPQPVLMTLGTHEVPASEFAYVYKKNNGSAPDAGTKASVQEYLNLYTNFKLKVLAAEAQGLDTTQAFKRELDGYKQQLAQPYLTEKSVTDQLVREAYDHMKKEVNASHILIRVTPEADPKDTLAAYNKVVALRQRVTGGEDFEKVARETSEDPSARENGGRLGYFTALQMVYPFEAAAYKTPVGQVSQPIRTRFGYHIIKVNDVRQAQGEIKVAHLMIRATPGMPKADSVMAKKKIDELYSRLQKGEDWQKTVAQFSEDQGSAANGGELPPFGTGRMIPSFEEAAFKLQTPGQLAGPVQTPYGWHIIKLIEKQPVPTFEQSEAGLKQKVARDSRSELNRAAFIKRVRVEDKFVEMTPVKDLLLAQADTSLPAGRFKTDAYLTRLSAVPGAKGKKSTVAGATPVFTINGKPYTVKDYADYVAAHQQPRPGTSPNYAAQLLYDQFVDQSLVDYERANLETKYEDYRMLVKEYRDGILLFQLMDEKVWSKAIEDTVGLQKYFEANQSKYQWEPRVQATVVSAATPELLKKAQQQMTVGRYVVQRDIIPTLYFQPGKANMTKESLLQRNTLFERLNNDPALTVRLTGQVKAGEKASLAKERVQSVADFLKRRKVADKRVAVATAPRPGTASVQVELLSNQLSVLEEMMNNQAQNPLGIQIQQRAFPKGENKVVDGVPQQPGTYTAQQDGRYYAVTVEKVLPAGPKTLAEARGQATSDYQNYLEQQWIQELRAKYPVKVNEAEVNKLVTK